MLWFFLAEACGILDPGQGSNPQPLHWKEKSYPLDPQGSSLNTVSRAVSPCSQLPSLPLLTFSHVLLCLDCLLTSTPHPLGNPCSLFRSQLKHCYLNEV